MKIGEVDYSGQSGPNLTFALASGSVVGDAVTLTAAGTVGRGSDGVALYGKLLKREGDGHGTIQKNGVVSLPTAAALTVGYQLLAVNGAGLAKIATGGRPCIVIGNVVEGSVNYAVIDLF